MSQKRNWFARHKVLTGTGALIAVITVGGVMGSGGDSTTSDSAENSTSAEKGDGDAAKGSAAKDSAKEEKKPAGFDGDGTFEIGADVKPGTYKSSGNSDGLCYWERAKDAEDNDDSIIANDNVTGTSYVTIKPTDGFFKSSDCGRWEEVPAKASGTPKTEMAGDGMYKIGTDIAPGTYKSTENTDDMCYWERDKDASHGLDSIIANDNVTGTAIVTIKADDGYFKTNGCSDWKKTG